jgi:hypothetical protein
LSRLVTYPLPENPVPEFPTDVPVSAADSASYFVVGVEPDVVTFDALLCADQLGTASLARTVIEYVVDAARPVTLKEVDDVVPMDEPFRNTS